MIFSISNSENILEIDITDQMIMTGDNWAHIKI